MRSHFSACEWAEQNLCRRQQCGGMMHRIEWALSAAEQESEEERRRRRVWLEGGLTTIPGDRRAAGAGEEVQSAVEQLRAGLVGLVSDAVRIEVDAIVGPPGTGGQLNSPRLGLADHFWCDLFAAIVQVAQDVQAGLDQIPDHLAGVVVYDGLLARVVEGTP